MRRLFQCAAAIPFAMTLAGSCAAGFVMYVSEGQPWGYPAQEQWFIDAGTYTTIDFVGLAPQPLSNQYAHLGVTFPGNDHTYTSPFLSDGYGVVGGLPWGPSIEVKFDQPRTAFAVLFPGLAYLKLFSGGVLIHTSGAWNIGALSFIGLIGDQPFDEVHIIDPLGDVHIDNIYFGAAIPGPGAMAPLMAWGLLSGVGRRRRR